MDPSDGESDPDLDEEEVNLFQEVDDFDDGHQSDDLPIAHPHPHSRSPSPTGSHKAPLPSDTDRAHVEDDVDVEPAAIKMYPGAGKVVAIDPEVQATFERESPRNGEAQNAYHPFANRMDWEVASWAKSHGPSQTAFTNLLKINGVQERLGLSYNNSRSLNQLIDEIATPAAWQSTQLQLGTDSYELLYRDPLECIRALYSNPAFVDNMSYAPKKEYSGPECRKEQRLFNEMCTGDWWYETQAKLPDGATVVPLVFSSDKTLLTNFSGDEAAYPLYLTIGNIAKDVRRKPSCHAHMLVGYLPTPHLGHLSDAVARTLRARIYHQAMKHIVQSLEDAGRHGVRLTSGDGAIRLCFPILACYVADFPEHRCPKCNIPYGCFGDARQPKQCTAAKQEEILKDAGLTDVPSPFWEKLPHCDIHRAITPDILHQLYQGMIKHLVAWASSIAGVAELDARFSRLPEMHDTRIFKDGISGLVRVSGAEHKEMCKQLLGCLVGAVPALIVKTCRALLNFLYIARYKSHSEETLGYLQDALDCFHKDKNAFLRLFARVGKGDGFNIPKLESLQHYVDSIRAFRTTDNCNSETSERLHIDFAKDRKEKVVGLNTKIEWRSGPAPTNTRIILTKAPNSSRVLFHLVQSLYGAADFQGDHKLHIPFDNINIWHKVKFILPNLQDDDLSGTMNAVTAKPGSEAGQGRFDTVIIDEDDTAQPTGVQGLDIPGHLAYVEWFSRPSRKEPASRMFIINKSQKSSGASGKTGMQASVIELETLRRGCQLIPRFGARSDRAWKTSNVLDRCSEFLLNNFSDQHAYQSIY
ncbi:hypothetical protein FA95DRAFT_1585466 [Auriscalpium vulgare]|uniref:Uncharacterized protein n=1 Tax=Auriscalpium vulgare TaxID=40419 RepID=A0ACB8R380_9AGAM|nr:hypothetical protein FA95DRAFT_1585466 [Auriscalpium vulgare]